MTSKQQDLAGPGISTYEEVAKILPQNYASLLTPKETMKAVYAVKQYIEENLNKELNLMMVQVPLIVDVKSGVNDMLDRDGSRTPIDFQCGLGLDTPPRPRFLVLAGGDRPVSWSEHDRHGAAEEVAGALARDYGVRTAGICCDVAEPEAVEAMTMIQGWFEAGYANANPADDTCFTSGACALAYVGHWTTAGHVDAVGPLLKCLKDEIGVDPARAHNPDDAHVGRILKPAHAS
mgnify:CR=1 FL=1